MIVGGVELARRRAPREYRTHDPLADDGKDETAGKWEAIPTKAAEVGPETERQIGEESIED